MELFRWFSGIIFFKNGVLNLRLIYDVCIWNLNVLRNSFRTNIYLRSNLSLRFYYWRWWNNWTKWISYWWLDYLVLNLNTWSHISNHWLVYLYWISLNFWINILSLWSSIIVSLLLYWLLWCYILLIICISLYRYFTCTSIFFKFWILFIWWLLRLLCFSSLVPHTNLLL